MTLLHSVLNECGQRYASEESSWPYDFVDHTWFANMLVFGFNIATRTVLYKSHHLTQIIKLDNVCYEIRRVPLLNYVFHL